MVDKITLKNDLGKLLSIKSIFQWNPIILEENLFAYEFEPQEDDKFNFMNFVIRFAKCYYTYSQDIESALKIITELENDCTKVYRIDEDDLFKKIKDAVVHVILAAKCSLLLKTEKKEISEILDEIKPFNDMDSCNKAAINAIHSAVIGLYSNEDMEKAFGYIEKAMMLDPDNARWTFLKGLYVQKVRKMTNRFEAPSLQEKGLFEDAFKLDPNNVAFMLHVADVYRELTAHASKRQNLCTNFLPRDNTLNSNLKGNIDQKIQKAKEYYRKAAEEYASSTYVMFHVAEGLLKLPHPHNDVKLAKKLIKAGLKKSPKNAEGNFVMAFCYEQFDKNSEMAKHHLKICQELKVFEAELNMIRIQYAEKLPSFDSIEALLNLLQKYKEKLRHAVIYSQLVSYYLLVEYDLVKACDYATKFYSLSTNSSCMQVHRSVFIRTSEPFALIDVLTDEVKFKMWSQQTPKPLREVCEKFVHFMNFQNVKIVQGYPQNFRKQILEGKPLVKNSKCMEPHQKNTGTNKKLGANPRAAGPKTNNRQDFKNSGRSAPFKPNKCDHTQTTRTFFDQWRETEKNKAQNVNQLPSLMDSLIITPPNIEPVVEKEPVVKERKPEPIRGEKHRKERLEKESTHSSSIDSSDEKLVKAFLKALKKKKYTHERRREHKKSSRRHRSPSTSSESEDDFTQAIIRRALSDQKNDRRKKHRSDSDDSKYRRRRRDRSRRRYSYSDSGDSSHRNRKHDRRHKRDFSPRGRRGRKSESSDSEFGYKLKSKNKREDRRSSDRQSRRDYSPRDERNNRDHRKPVERSPSADHLSTRSQDLTKRSKKERDHRSTSKDRPSRKRIEQSPSAEQSSVHSQDEFTKSRTKKERSRRSASKDRLLVNRSRRERSPSFDRSSVRSDVTKSRSKKDRGHRSVSKDKLSSKNYVKKAIKKRDRRSPNLPPSGDYDSESNSSHHSRSQL